MWQFMLGSDEAFAVLEARARQRCVRFREQEMPPGAAPARATIGFEVDPASGVARLFVDRGVRYEGLNDDIRSWFESGQRRFDSFDKLRSWLASALRPAYLETVTTLPGPLRARELAEGDEPDLDLDDVDAKALRLALRQSRRKGELPS